VAQGDNGQPQIEIERPPLREQAANEDIRPRRWFDWRHSDPLEPAAQRRARRQGLMLMIASSLLTTFILYGAWVALRGH
jgi:hypothetical protein